MSFETALRSRLKAADGIGAVPTEWSVRRGYPAIVLTIASWPIAQHMTDFDTWQRPRVQIDVFALDAPTKVTLRDAVLAAIKPAGSHGGVRFGRAHGVTIADLGEEIDTDFIHRDMIEAVLPHYKET